MRIFYDGYVYSYQGVGGINRYFVNLINRLPNNFSPVLTTCRSLDATYPIHPQLKTFFYQRFGFRPGRLSYWLEKYYFRTVTAQSQPNIAHPTYYSLLTRQEVNKYPCPIVLTVWDMIHELFYPNDQQIEDKRKAILAAQAILCISENTKKDLLKFYSIPENKITVTPLAPEIDKSLSYGPERIPSKPYYFYVGGRAGYKNFDTCLAAFARVVSVRPEVSLCVVGPPFSHAEEKSITSLKLSNNIEHYGFASDRHLAKLYRCSITLVYPSLYEGFGIPPLEAMSCGTAVVASNCSSIPEVVGDAGLLFDPKSVKDLADILLLLLDNPMERDRLIVQGQQRVNLFSWDQTAARTLDVYNTLA